MHRHNVNKHQASRKFIARTARTKQINVAPPAMRGGYRM